MTELPPFGTDETDGTDSPDGADTFADVLVDTAATDLTAVEVEPDVEVDPAFAFRDALRRDPGDWFVVHTYAGYENKAKANLETRIQSLNM